MILTENSFTCLNNTDLDVNFINSLNSLKNKEFILPDLYNKIFYDAVSSIEGFPSDNSQSAHYLQTIMDCVETKSRSYNDVDGKDLNRNYEYMNNTQNQNAWSEPEVRAIRDLLLERPFVAGISYHSYGSLVLRSWDFDRSIDPPDIIALNTLGIELSENNPVALTTDPTDHYVFNDLYDALGTSTDYSYGEFGTFCYTIELEPKGVFAPTVENKDIICDANIPAAHYLINRLSYSMLTGHITDQQTNQPIIAEIKVEGIDDFNNTNQKPIHKSDQAFGRYYRLLNPGSYNVTVSANGYTAQTFNNMAISGTDITELDVKLLKDNMANNTDIDFTFEYNNYTPGTNPEYKFTGIASNITSEDPDWQWTFSSGSPVTKSGQIVTHSFAVPEIAHTITLKVTFTDGSTKSKTQKIYPSGYPFGE